MGWIGRIKSFTRKTIKGVKFDNIVVDNGTGNNHTSEYFSSSGDDSQPLGTDKVVTTDNQREGGQSVVGVVDVKNEGVTQPGEKRIYSRRPNGDVISEIYLKNTGVIEIVTPVSRVISDDLGNIKLFNDRASLEVTSGGELTFSNSLTEFSVNKDGSFTLGKVTIDVLGNIVTPGTYNGQSLPI